MADIFTPTTKLQQGRAIVDAAGRPTTEFQTLINTNNKNVDTAIRTLASIPEIRQALLGLSDATQAAQDAVAAFQSQNDLAKRESAIVNSFIVPSSVLSATPTTISIAAHTRMYADGTTASVPAGTVSATGHGDTDYVYYEDYGRKAQGITYVATTTPPVQTGDTHVVGAVTIPATGTQQGGEGPRQPGFVTPRQPQP